MCSLAALSLYRCPAKTSGAQYLFSPIINCSASALCRSTHDSFSSVSVCELTAWCPQLSSRGHLLQMHRCTGRRMLEQRTWTVNPFHPPASVPPSCPCDGPRQNLPPWPLDYRSAECFGQPNHAKIEKSCSS